MQVTTQLAFEGQCREVFALYEEVLGGKIVVMNTFGDSDAKLPPGSEVSAPEQIRFAELRIGDYAILRNDVPDPEYRPMQGFNIALHVKTADEARWIFNAFRNSRRALTTRLHHSFGANHVHQTLDHVDRHAYRVEPGSGNGTSP